MLHSEEEDSFENLIALKTKGISSHLTRQFVAVVPSDISMHKLS